MIFDANWCAVVLRSENQADTICLRNLFVRIAEKDKTERPGEDAPVHLDEDEITGRATMSFSTGQ